MHPNTKDLTGMRFGRLLVLNISEKRGNKNQIKFDCKCDCGNNHTVTSESLRGGKSKSCGCLRNNAPNKQKDREYAIWKQLYNSNIVRQNKKWGIDNGITLDEFKILANGLCFYCGMEGINKLSDRGHYKINGKLVSDTVVTYNGIDRIDSNIGYIEGNVVTCCKHCNIAKSTMSQEEFYNLIKRIYEYNNLSSLL